MHVRVFDTLLDRFFNFGIEEPHTQSLLEFTYGSTTLRRMAWRAYSVVKPGSW